MNDSTSRRCRVYDEYLGDTSKLDRLAERGTGSEYRAAAWVLIGAFIAVLVVLGWAAWTTEAKILVPHPGTSPRGGEMPAIQPVAERSTGLRGKSHSPVDAAEISRDGGEVGAARPLTREVTE